MASFTDEKIELAPYTQQLPIQEMAMTGMRREAQFEEGISKVQSYYDSLLGLPIAKQEVQNYVKEKVGQLNKAVKQSISGDFSDRRLTNQIGGLAARISNDPIVEAGVQSTAKIQAGLAKQKADQELNAKNGKTPTNNINDFNDRVNAYLMDGRADTQFNDTYTPYVDVIDRAIKLFKDQNPGQTLDADAFFYNSQGQLEYNPVYFKGVDPSRIQSILNLVYSQPDVQAQLAVDGRQTYKNIDQPTLALALEKSTNENLATIQAAIRDLQLKAVTDPSANSQEITNQISALKKRADELKSGFSSKMSLLESNPEALKAKLVQDDITSNFINAYAYKVMEKSPLFDADMEKKKFDQQLKEFEWKKKKDEFDMSISERDIKVKESKEEREKGGTSNGGFSSINTVPLEQAQGKLGPQTAEADLTDAQNNYVQSRRELASLAAMGSLKVPGMPSIAPPYIKDPATGEWKWNNLQYKSEADANGYAKLIYNTLNDQYNKGVMSGDLLEVYQKSLTAYNTLQDKTRVVKEVETMFAPKIEELKQKIGNLDYASAYIVQKKLPGWEIEESKLKSKYGEDWKVGIGIESVRIQGKSDIPYKVSGPKSQEYNKAIKDLEPSAVSIITQRNAEYKNRQTAQTSKSATFDISKPELYKDALTKISGILKPMAEIPGASTSDAEAFLEQMDEKGTGPFTSLNAYYDRFSKEGVIQGWKGDKKYEVRVAADRLYESFPQLQVDTRFDNLYQSRLNISRANGFGRSTDVDGKGRAGEPYIIPHPNYIVQYHIDEIADGRYNIKYYITDKKNPAGPSIIDGDYYLPSAGNKQQILEAINTQLSNKEFIEQLVQRKKLNQ